MKESDYRDFAKAINELACCYLRQLEGPEIAAYYTKLLRYPIEMVVKALERAPEISPSKFPAAGQLIEICDAIAGQERYTADSVTLIRASAECEHQDEFEPEPEGGLYLGFDVCVHCGRAKPVINQAAPPVQLDKYRMAVNPSQERSGGDWGTGREE
jgi:hypothetical protein